MRRITLVLAAVLVVVAMMAMTATAAFAQLECLHPGGVRDVPGRTFTVGDPPNQACGGVHGRGFFLV